MKKENENMETKVNDEKYIAKQSFIADINTLKIKVINLIINEVTVKIAPFIKNNLLFSLKIIHLIKDI